MKKVLFFLLSCFSLWAQDRKYVSSPTIAYNDAKSSKAVGIFLRGAQISEYVMVDSYIYKVPMVGIGYVYITDNYNIKDRLNARDRVENTPALFVDFDEYYGAPHLFTTVAGLKVREFPDIQSKVLGTLLNGTVVPVYFYPYDESGWVSVVIDNKIGYIPRKYIGRRPAMKDLIDFYKNASTEEQQQKYAERIIELGWNSYNTDKPKAFRIFAEHLSKKGETEQSKLLLAQAKVLEGVKEWSDSKTIVDTYLEENRFGFVLGSKIEGMDGFSLSDLQKYLGKITDSYVNLDDCGLDDFEDNVLFSNAELIHNTNNHTYTIRRLDMVDETGFQIGTNVYDQHSNEIDFLEQNVGVINWIASGGVYGITFDGIAYEFHFHKGKLKKVHLIIYC